MQVSQVLNQVIVARSERNRRDGGARTVAECTFRCLSKGSAAPALSLPNGSTQRSAIAAIPP